MREVKAMLPGDDEERALIERCRHVGSEEALELQRDFCARRAQQADHPLRSRHREQAQQRLIHAAKARKCAKALVIGFNQHHRELAWGVVTTLVGQYLTVADGASRFEVTDDLPLAETMPDYWSAYAPKSLVAQVCFVQAVRAGRAIRLGLWEDGFHDRHPSRQARVDPEQGPDAIVRRPHRDIAIGLDEAGRPVVVKRRAKWELYASTYIENRSAGAWLGLMATTPPPDWDQERMLANEHWGPEFGHPACILPERPGTISSLMQGSMIPMLGFAGPGPMKRVEPAAARVWARRRRKGVLLEEPSFAPYEAIKLLGAAVGIDQRSEAAARNMFRLCYHRARAGLLQPAWSLRLCRHEVCSEPLFLYEIASGHGDAPPPNYCRLCSPQQASHRRKRSRRRARLRDDAQRQHASDPTQYPSMELPRPTRQQLAEAQQLLHQMGQEANAKSVGAGD